MCSGVPKQYKRAHKLSAQKGWSWTRRTNHIEVRDGRGEFVACISTTAYDGSLTRVILGKLRRAGCPGVA